MNARQRSEYCTIGGEVSADLRGRWDEFCGSFRRRLAAAKGVPVSQIAPVTKKDLLAAALEYLLRQAPEEIETALPQSPGSAGDDIAEIVADTAAALAARGIDPAKLQKIVADLEKSLKKR